MPMSISCVQVADRLPSPSKTPFRTGNSEDMKERLATEKLYLEDEIRLDHNNGNMVGERAAFQSVLKGVQIVAPHRTPRS